MTYVESTHALQLERPDGVSGQLLSVSQRNTHDSVVLCAPAGPVLVALDPRPLF